MSADTPATFAPGTRVRFTGWPIGTIRLADPYSFTEYIASADDTGEVVSEPGAVPEGWVLVKLDYTPDDGGTLHAPVHPAMIEAAS